MPIITDQYCLFGYQILVHDNITSNTILYTDSNRFELDPLTGESYLIQNIVASAPANSIILRVFTTTTVASDLNKYWRDPTDDTYLYTVNIKA